MIRRHLIEAEKHTKIKVQNGKDNRGGGAAAGFWPMATGLSPGVPSIPAAPTHPPATGKPGDAGPPAWGGFLELSADFFICRLPLHSFFSPRGLVPRPFLPLVPIHPLSLNTFTSPPAMYT